MFMNESVSQFAPCWRIGSKILFVNRVDTCKVSHLLNKQMSHNHVRRTCFEAAEFLCKDKKNKEKIVQSKLKCTTNSYYHELNIVWELFLKQVLTGFITEAPQSVGNLKIKEILHLSCSLCVFIHWVWFLGGSMNNVKVALKYLEVVPLQYDKMF